MTCFQLTTSTKLQLMFVASVSGRNCLDEHLRLLKLYPWRLQFFKRGIAVIVDGLYRRDALPVVIEVFVDFSDLISLHRG